MPMPHADMKRLIQRRLKGTEGTARLQVIKECMSMLPGYKQGPYADLRKWLLREVEVTRKRRESKHAEELFIPKDGDARVVLLGVPNAGKSSLLRALSRSRVEVGDYAFTTLRPIAATAEINQARIQLVEIPGLIEGARENRGSGRFYLGAAQTADAFLVLMPLEHGGIEGLRMLLEETRDVIQGRRALLIATKLDLPSAGSFLPEVEAFAREADMPVISVSATTGQGIDNLISAIWDLVGLMRVFGKQGEKEDDRPFIVPRGSTVRELAAHIHKELEQNLLRAVVWGPSARFPGQAVGKDHILQDCDHVELVVRR
ncbi:MAG: GTPase [Bacillota bacterium]